MTKSVETDFEGNIKRWDIREFDAEQVQQLAEKLKIEPVLAKLLIARNLDKVDDEQLKRFLHPKRTEITTFENISSADQIKKACQRLVKAIRNKEKIMINGDPDADGIAGTTVLVAGLNYLGADVVYDFPVRSREGHGLQPRIIEDAKQQNITVIMTIDCGTKDVEAVNYANSLGLDVIICDHHILGNKIPSALAMINPYMNPTAVAEHELCGSLLGFKFILALAHFLRRKMPVNLSDFLLSVASLGALSDRVSLLEPMNRIMIEEGIKALNFTEMEGLKALRRSCVGAETVVRPNEASRSIVPKLNAPGRIGDPEEAIPDSNVVVDLLLLGVGKKSAKKASKLLKILRENFLDKKRIDGDDDDDVDSVINKVATIENINERRKKITSQIEDEIENQLPSALKKNQRIIIIKGHNWNSGVIGIDADRTKERFLKPVIIFTSKAGNDYYRASVRSIPTVNMYGILNKISDDFEQKFNKKLFCFEVQTKLGKEIVNSFGGHPQACGFSVHKDNLDQLVEDVYKAVDNMPSEQFQFSYEIIETVNFAEIKPAFAKKFDKLSPFGQRFDMPIFLLKKCRLTKARAFGSRYQVSQTPHVEFQLLSSQPIGKEYQKIKAVGYGLNKKFKEMVTIPETQRFDVIFTLELCKEKIGRGNNSERLNVNVLDIRRSIN